MTAAEATPDVVDTDAVDTDGTDGTDKGKGGAATREYVVLEETYFEGDEDPSYTVLGTVSARNAVNALRKAYRQHKANDEATTDDVATLVPIPMGMWRPTSVRGRRRSSVAIQVGDEE